MCSIDYSSFFSSEQKQLLYTRLEEFTHIRANGRRGRRNLKLEDFLKTVEDDLLKQFGDTQPLVMLQNRNNLRRVSISIIWRVHRCLLELSIQKIQKWFANRIPRSRRYSIALSTHL